MVKHEQEAHQPFLDGDYEEDSADDSIELPELSDRSTRHQADFRPAPKSKPISHQPGPENGGNGVPFHKPPISPRRPATYAILFMLGAQIFSAFMNVSIRLLENASTHLHPLQILFVRMSVTTFGITFWLWRQKKPNTILGKKENRPLLLLRAFGGFLGVFGLYYSLRYLNLSEATVITFMMPLVASFGGYMFLGSTISWLEILLSIISLFGVLLVASPGAIFTTDLNDSEPGDPGSVDASSSSRVWAICIGLLGVCGSAAAFLCMSYIGKAESPLTVVNYFAALCTLASFIALILLPGLGFQAPVDMWEWGLLFFSGLSGFFMQFLITMSLQAEKSLVAVNMVYTQIVFALALDAMVFHTMPHSVSLAGCALICSSAIFLAWHRTRTRAKSDSPEDGSR